MVIGILPEQFVDSVTIADRDSSILTKAVDLRLKWLPEPQRKMLQ